MVVAAIFLSLTISAISASVFTPAAFADDTLLVAQSATSDDAVNAGADDSAGTPVDQAISGAEGGDFSTPLAAFASPEMAGEGAVAENGAEDFSEDASDQQISGAEDQSEEPLNGEGQPTENSAEETADEDPAATENIENPTPRRNHYR